MKYSDVQKYEAVYTLQAKVDRLQERLVQGVMLAMPADEPGDFSDRQREALKQQILENISQLRLEAEYAKVLGSEYAKLIAQ